jgi:curli biogenesis system outer membrane secretion channel CsgG
MSYMRHPSKNWLTIILLFIFPLSIGCSTIEGIIHPSEKSGSEVQYNGPKANVVVTKFINISSKGKTGVQTEDGMTEMFGNALLATNRYILRMRSSPNGLKQISQGADLLVEGTITQFELGKTQDGRTQPSSISLILNVSDIKTERKLISQNVVARAPLMEKAIKMAIEESVQIMVTKTPSKYYRVSSIPTTSPPPPKENLKSPKNQPMATTSPSTTPEAKSDPPLRIIQVIWPYVNLRNGPGTHYKNVGSVKKGTSLALLEDDGDWLRIRLQDGKEVWVNKEATTLAQKPQTPPPSTPAPTSTPEKPNPM